MKCLDPSGIARYREGRLPQELAAEVARHLADCARCKALLGDTSSSAPTDPVEHPTMSLSGSVAPPTGSTAPLSRGTTLGRYIVVGQLGEGGMGVVYHAYDPELDRRVALKLLRAESSQSTAASERQARLLREAQAMARLSHPNVIAVHDVGTYEDNVFIAMELVEGTTLKEWLRESPRSWREVVEVFLAAGKGLAAAHDAGIVHRDFKPSNVLVGSDGRVRVMDFGVARALRVGAESSAPAGDALALSRALDAPLTLAGSVVGTPRYMAPEQWQGRAVDPRTDQFSFALALYEALYLEHSPAGDGHSGEPISWESVVSDPPKGSRVPRSVRRVILRGLKENPDERYPSMQALLEELRRDPAAMKRRWAAAAGIVTLVVLGLAGYQQAAKHQGLLCKGAERKLVGVWDESRKHAIEAAFRASEKTYAADTWQRVARVLDVYTDAWVAMHTEACEATRVRGEQSEEVLSLRMMCLAQRIEEVKALTDVFMRPDERVVEKAAPAAHALSALASCADVQALGAPVRPPADEATRAEVDEVRKKLAQGKALRDAGKFKDGLGLANEAALVAEKIGYRPLEAEAFTLRGNLLEKSGDPKGAEAPYKEALWAAEAGRDDRAAGEAATRLVYLLGGIQTRYDEATDWSRYAQAAIERLGGDEKVEADLALSVGTVFGVRKRYDEALPYLERAAVISARAYGPNHPVTARCHINLGNAFGETGRHTEALPHYQQALAILESALGPDHPDTATPINNLANLFFDLGRYDDALKNLRRAVDIWNNTLGPQHPNTAIALINLGNVLTAKGQPQEALRYHGQSLATLERIFGPHHPAVGAVLEGLGGDYLALGRLDEALSAYQRALAAQEKSLGADNPALVTCLTGIGEVHLAQGVPAAAAAPLERGLRIAEAHPDDSTALANARFALARALWDTRRDSRRARELLAMAREEYARLPDKNKSRLTVSVPPGTSLMRAAAT